MMTMLSPFAAWLLQGAGDLEMHCLEVRRWGVLKGMGGTFCGLAVDADEREDDRDRNRNRDRDGEEGEERKKQREEEESRRTGA